MDLLRENEKNVKTAPTIPPSIKKYITLINQLIRIQDVQKYVRESVNF